jgi:hypothetical protein
MKFIAFWSSFLVVTLITLTTFTDNKGENRQALPEAITPPCLPASVNNILDASPVMNQLEINIPKLRKWYVNLINANSSSGSSINEKYKKKFAATIKVNYSGEKTCSFPSKVRLSGDWKDHIRLTGTYPEASMDVSLLFGNIYGIVDFKLLLPETRLGDAEIVNSELFRSLGFITPRIYKVDVSVFGKVTPMLLQEKPSKELLEFNNLRESALLEVNEGLLWANREKLFTEQVTNENWHRQMFARLTNSKWALAGDVNKSIAFRGLRILQRVISEAYNWEGGRVNATNSSAELIGNNLKTLKKEAKRYEILSVATGAYYALINNNRQYYFDPLLDGLRPIYNEGLPAILKRSSDKKGFLVNPFGPPIWATSQSDVLWVENNLKKISVKILVQDIQAKGVEIDQLKMNGVLDWIFQNLELMKSNIRQNKLPKWVAMPHVNVPRDLQLVFGNSFDDLVMCEKSLSVCQQLELDANGQRNMLRGRLMHGNSYYVYAGPSKTSYEIGLDPVEALPLRSGIRRITLGESDILLIGKPIVKVESSERTIYMNLLSHSDRVVIRNGLLKDWRIKFKGAEGEDTSGGRFDEWLLTGCLTLLDMEVENVSIHASGGRCEDSINLVRVTGELKDLQILSAYQDAIDIDFSDVHMDLVEVHKAGNDCFDVSAGNYSVGTLIASKCGDKAVSVGEGSTLEIQYIKISNAVTGLVAKDSSQLVVESGSINDVPLCFSAYRKKQEFGGAIIILRDVSCEINEFAIQEGSVLERTL